MGRKIFFNKRILTNSDSRFPKTSEKLKKSQIQVNNFTGLANYWGGGGIRSVSRKAILKKKQFFERFSDKIRFRHKKKHGLSRKDCALGLVEVIEAEQG